ncbi:MAG: CTP synthase [Vigna little leaf phytoplasma]|nr:CTP synthase [Vigna little leaf phytoplasma]
MNSIKTKNKKFIFITGGVVSGLGKGIIAAAIGRILKQRGIKVFIQKFDPYINVDPGTMNPFQHGEVFVTNDGAETDLDLGHYERFLDENLFRESNVTTGQIYQSVISKERKGEYLGKTIQIIPHITNEIKNKILQTAHIMDYDVIIVEIGGTVGDIESLPFLEAIRQMRYNIGFHNTLYIHNTLIPYLKTSNEIKTKPTQHSIKELRSLGIQPQILILRSEKNIPLDIKEKIAILCDVNPKAIFENIDTDILYNIIVHLHQQKIDDFILQHFQLQNFSLSDLSQYNFLINKIRNLKKQITVGLICKYFSYDAYLSIIEALKHASCWNDTNIQIKWIDAEILTDENINTNLKDCDGIIVPGGFGVRGIEGKIKAIRYAREKNIPFFGICLGLQTAVIEYARNILNLKKANSTEFAPKTILPIITDKIKTDKFGGTLRLGLQACQLTPHSKSANIFQQNIIYERHRHRYEVNPKYISLLESDHNFIIAGIHPTEKLIEIIEIKNHIWFVAVQFHPEFLSRPFKPHPLFKDFIRAILNNPFKIIKK